MDDKFDLFHDVFDWRSKFRGNILQGQTEINSELILHDTKAGEVNFDQHFNTVTERKKRLMNSGTQNKKQQSVLKENNLIKTPNNMEPCFIPTEVQLSLFKASVIGRREAEQVLKNSCIKKCTTSVLSSGKKQDENCTPKKTSAFKKRCSLFGEAKQPSKFSHTPEHVLDPNNIENYSPNNFQLHENSSQNNVNLELLQTPKIQNNINTAPVSGIKKLTESPITSNNSPPYSYSVTTKATTAPSEMNSNLCIPELSNVILKDVVAFVDVRSDSENRSRGVKDVLHSMGAKIENYFTKKVTVVVFKDGLISTYKRAKLWGIPMVSILWIEACKEEMKIVSTELHPPLGLDKYEKNMLTLDLGTKKKCRKKLGEEAMNSPQTRSKKKEELEKSRNLPSTVNTLPVVPKTPSHADGFIQALLTVAGDELKDFLNRPLRQPLDEDFHLNLPLSVRLLHKHVIERRAMTTAKESLGSFEENIRTLCDKGRMKLRKLVFPPSVEEENEAILRSKESNNHEFEKQKRSGNSNRNKIFQLENYFSNNIRKSAPAILFKNRSRQSAPAKFMHRKIATKISNAEDGNIVKYFLKTTGIENSINSKNYKDEPHISKNNLPFGESKNKNILNKEKKCTDTNIDILTQSKGENVLTNVENTAIKRKRKLLPLGSNIYLTEPVCTNCDPDPILCPYKESPQKKNIKNLGTQNMYKLFIKPSAPKKKLKSPTSSDNETSSFNHRGSSVLFIEAKKKKTDVRVTPTIVCTSIHRKDLDTILSMINQLGKFTLEQGVSERTTHVVTCAARRTINLLKGISRGAWILRDEWITKSFECGKWLNEEPFELVEFSPAVKQSRIERLAFGSEFCLELFKHVGYIYVSKGTSPPTADIIELLRICGGKVVSNARKASIIVGSKTGYNVIRVTEKWVLDSITHNIQLDPQLYKH